MTPRQLTLVHTWEEEYVDGGHVDGDFWICRACGASGGPVFSRENPPTFAPFLADGSGLKVGDDCVEAKRIIEEHRAKKAKKEEEVYVSIEEPKLICPHDGAELVAGQALGRPNEGRLWVSLERREKIKGVPALRSVSKCPKCGYSEAP